MSPLFKKLAIKKTILYLVISGIFVAFLFIENNNLFNYATAWLLSINLTTFFVMMLDKLSSKMNGWNRIPEGTLLWLSFFGGFPGFFLARYVFKHKTTKKEFQAPMWGMFILQLAVVIYYTMQVNGFLG